MAFLSTQFLVKAQQVKKLERPRRVFPVIDNEMPEEWLRIDTNLVVIDVTVTDAKGLPVRGLQSKDFKIFEDGVERPVTFLNFQEKTDFTQPLAIVFALDVSGSITAQETNQLRKAVQAFINKLGLSQNIFAIMSFGMKVKFLQSFTNDQQKLQEALMQLDRETNGLTTHIYDAVDDAVRHLVRKAPQVRQKRLVKKAVIVISDGFSVGDTVSPSTVIERANRENVGIYTVTLPSYSHLASTRFDPLPTPLDVSGLVEKTGGVNLYANTKDLEPILKSLAEEISSTYALGFYPSEEKKLDGRFHTVRIQVPSKYSIRQSRNGYQANKEIKRDR